MSTTYRDLPGFDNMVNETMRRLKKRRHRCEGRLVLNEVPEKPGETLMCVWCGHQFSTATHNLGDRCPRTFVL